MVYDCFTALPTASLASYPAFSSPKSVRKVGPWWAMVGHGGPWWGHGELDQETVVPDAGELSSIDAEPSDEAMV